MNFYYYTNPYRAMVTAEDEDTANKLYEDSVSDRDQEDGSPKLLTEEEARQKWDARGGKEPDDMTFEELFSTKYQMVVLVEGSLL